MPASPALRAVTTTADALLLAMLVAWVLNLPSTLGVGLFAEQFLAAGLGVCLFLIFLTNPLGRSGVGMLDWALALLGLGSCFYVAIRYPTLMNEIVARPVDGIAVAAIICTLILEATRRTSGWSLTLVIIGLGGWAYFGYLLPGVFATRPVHPARLVAYLALDTNALLGQALMVGLVTVGPFIVMSQVLSRAGGGEFFTDIATALMGRFRGGSAKIAVFGSALFGMISGSAVANVACVGAVTIPLMQRAGFPARLAAAVEAVGSTGGQLMPPVMGAAAFLMAEYLRIPYAEVMVAAIIPAGLYYAALFIQVDLEAARLGIAGMAQTDTPRALTVLRQGWHFLVPFAILIVGLMRLNWQPEYAALVATASLVMLAMIFPYRGKRLRPLEVVSTLVGSSRAMLDIIAATAAAGLVTGCLNISGLSFGLTNQLLELGGGNLPILLAVTAVAAFILGMGLPTVGVYVILATLAAPALTGFGLLPLQAHFFVFYFGMMSMVTPPVALAAFAAANIAKTDFWSTGWTATRLGWSAYIIPFGIATSPTFLMRGDPMLVVLSVVTALLGVLLVSMALVGQFIRPLSATARLVAAALGIILFLPADAFAGALAVNLAALASGAAFLAVKVGPWTFNRRHFHQPRG